MPGFLKSVLAVVKSAVTRASIHEGFGKRAVWPYNILPECGPGIISSADVKRWIVHRTVQTF